MKTKHVLLIGVLPITLILLGMAWNLILKGFTYPSDATVLISAFATGGLFVAIFFSIKFIITKIK